MYGSLVFYNARLLDTFHKLLQLHVFLRQLEALYGTLLVPVAVASAFPLLVPLDPTDKPFQFWPSVCLWRDFVNYYYSADQYGYNQNHHKSSDKAQIVN